jgi:antirestriction protein ArdC
MDDMDKKAYAAKKHEEVKAMMEELAVKLTSSEAVAGFLNKKIYVLDAYDIPCAKWSFMNQFFVHLAGTCDARGYDQWKQIGRQVKKGAHAAHILVPCFGKKESDDGEEEKFLKFFKSVPVFRAEDTEGADLPYQAELDEMSARVVSLPLIQVAEKIGVSVTYGFSTGAYYGYYRSSAKKIVLCTDAEQTFFHELAHAVDDKLGTLEYMDTKGRNMAEIVAEFTACFLASQYGKMANLLYTRQYLAGYGKVGDVFKALDRAAKIAAYIIAEAEKLEAAA